MKKAIGKLLLLSALSCMTTSQLNAQKPYNVYEIKDSKIEKCINDLMLQVEEYIKDGGDDRVVFREKLKKEDVKYGLHISQNVDGSSYLITLAALNDLNVLRWNKAEPDDYDGIVRLGDELSFYSFESDNKDIAVKKDSTAQIQYKHPIITGVEIYTLYYPRQDLIVSKSVQFEGVTYSGKEDNIIIQTNKAKSVKKLPEKKIPFADIKDNDLKSTIAEVVKQMDKYKEDFNEDNTILYLNIDNNYKDYIDIHLTAYYRSLESMANLNPDGVIILGQDTIFYEGRFMPDVMKTSDNKAYFSFNPESISRKGTSSKENEYDRYLMGFKIRYNPNRDIIYQKTSYFGKWYYTNGASE